MNLPLASGPVGLIVATSNISNAERVEGDCAKIPQAATAGVTMASVLDKRSDFSITVHCGRYRLCRTGFANATADPLPPCRSPSSRPARFGGSRLLGN